MLGGVDGGLYCLQSPEDTVGSPGATGECETGAQASGGRARS